MLLSYVRNAMTYQNVMNCKISNKAKKKVIIVETVYYFSHDNQIIALDVL